jgi:hypothetical protein
MHSAVMKSSHILGAESSQFLEGRELDAHTGHLRKINVCS